MMKTDPSHMLIHPFLVELSNVITPTLLKQWDDFYTEITQSTGYCPTTPQSTATQAINDTVANAVTPPSTLTPSVSDADADERPQTTLDSALTEETNPAITSSDIHMRSTFHDESVRIDTYRTLNQTHAPSDLDVVAAAATNPPYKQQLSIPVLPNSSQYQPFPTPTKESDDATSQREWTIQGDRTSTDRLDVTMVRLHNRLDYMALQNTRHYATMTKINAKILSHLQQIVQLMPNFLAKISEHVLVPSMPQPYDNPQNTQTAKTSPHSGMRPWKGTDRVEFLPLKIQLSHWPLCTPVTYAQCLPIKNTPISQTFIPAKPPFTRRTPTLLWHRTKDHLRPP